MRKGANDRDKNGRFVKGNCANPGGRRNLPSEFIEYGRDAPARLRAIADDSTTPLGVKVSIEKWFAEMYYGKAARQVDLDGKIDQPLPVVVIFDRAGSECSVQ